MHLQISAELGQTLSRCYGRMDGHDLAHKIKHHHPKKIRPGEGTISYTYIPIEHWEVHTSTPLVGMSWLWGEAWEGGGRFGNRSQKK